MPTYEYECDACGHDFEQFQYFSEEPLTKCPSCKRINVFRRTRTGRRREGRDDAGDLRRTSTEYVCSRCGGQYWIVWDDFEGCRASMFAAPDADTEPGAGGGRGGG